MPVNFQHTELPNGLNILAEVDPAAHSAAIGFFVKTGARDEASDVMGVSHFLEHMMFKGTTKRTAADVDRDFENVGAEHNAFTTAEMTAFWAHCLPEHLGTCEGVLSDILRPSIRAEDFEAEKHVILEEIAMYEDHPFWVLYERAMEAYYGEHPLSHRVLGTKQSIADLTREQMVEYFEHRYSADNTVVALTGNVDFEAVVGRLADHCGAWQRTGATRAIIEPKPPRQTFTERRDNVSRHYMLMLAPAPPIESDQRYAASMLTHVLGDAEGSRLYWALVETGIAEEAQADYSGRNHAGEFLVYVNLSPDDAERAESLVRQEIVRLIDSLDEDDLERSRSKIATGATLHGELPAGRMRRLGRLWTARHEYRSLEDELARINAVTLEDLRNVAAAFPLEPWVIGHMTGV